MMTCKNNSKIFISANEEETKKFALSFMDNLIKTKQKNIAFSGDLGVGKTRFIKGMLTYFSNICENEITSPTFNYLNIYPTNPLVYHFDLYRISDETIFLSMGFEEYFEKNGICLIEWADHISSILPKNTTRINITALDEKTRRIEIL